MRHRTRSFFKWRKNQKYGSWFAECKICYKKYEISKLSWREGYRHLIKHIWKDHGLIREAQLHHNKKTKECLDRLHAKP